MLPSFAPQLLPASVSEEAAGGAANSVPAGVPTRMGSPDSPIAYSPVLRGDAAMEAGARS